MVGAVGWIEVGASTVEVTVYPATEEAMHAKAKTCARRAWLLTLCKCRNRRRLLKLVDVPALTATANRSMPKGPACVAWFGTTRRAATRACSSSRKPGPFLGREEDARVSEKGNPGEQKTDFLTVTLARSRSASSDTSYRFDGSKYYQLTS